jgi:hypothetical protein
MTAPARTVARPAIAVGAQVRIGPGFTETGLLATVQATGPGDRLVLQLGLTRVDATTADIQPAADTVACAHCRMRDAVLRGYCGPQCANNADHVTEADWWRRAAGRAA